MSQKCHFTIKIRRKILYRREEYAVDVALFQVLEIWVDSSDEAPHSWSNDF